MNPDTVEGLLILGKMAVIIGGGCAVTLGSIWGTCALAINYFQRRDRRDELLALYEKGTLTTRPTIFNAHRFPGHQA
jgi:hypothetical protein